MSSLVGAALLALVAAFVPPFIAAIAAVLLAAFGIAMVHPHGNARFGWSLVVFAIAMSFGLRSHVLIQLGESFRLPVELDLIVRMEGHCEHLDPTGGGEWRSNVSVTRIETPQLILWKEFEVAVTGSGPGPPVGSRISFVVHGLSHDGRYGYRATTSQVHVVSVARAFRYGIVRRVDALITRTTGASAPLLRALFLGERDGLSVRAVEHFRRAGVSHVLALSGMHLALITGIVTVVLRPFVGRRISLAIGALSAVLYTLVIGPRPSLVRSTIMCVFAVAMLVGGRRLRLLELVSGSFIVHLALQPQEVFSVSGTLSYAALVGIATVTPAAVRELRPWIPVALSAPLAAGIGAQSVSAPILLSSFSRFYPIGIIVGAIAGPLVAAFMGLGLVVLVLDACGMHSASAFVVLLLDHLRLLIEWIVWWCSAAPAASPPQWSLIFLSCSLVCAGIVWERYRIRWTSQI